MSKLKTKKSKKGGGAGGGKANVATSSGGGREKGDRNTRNIKPEESATTMASRGDTAESIKKKCATSTTSSDGDVVKSSKSSSKKKSSSISTGSGNVDDPSKSSSKMKKKSKAEASVAAASSSSKKSATDGGKRGKTSKKKGGDSNKPSAGTLALQKKWKDAAEAMGGTRIVVNKGEAKKIVFDMLHDSFRPMNITEIHKALKGEVPSPVLKACLDEMTLDTSGGDEPDDDPFTFSSKKSNKKSAGDDSIRGDAATSNNYVDSLLLKAGRNVNNSLYYVNQEKLPHDGNGLPPDERNELIGKQQKSAHEKDSDAATLRDITAQTSQLLSEPTNKEATASLAEGEKSLADLKERVEESRKHAGNEKKRATTKKRIRTLADFWWKRRRLCKDFLETIEDMTEGTISAKKCLAGDGQIELESDETVIKDALAAYESKKARGGFAAKRQGGNDSLSPTDIFVAVSMDTAGHTTRVYADVAK